ncbi:MULTISPECIES: hypothetical protein [Clostridium]|uniref:Uncharacterized protein n=1 Tax=Clostridium cadaveris TaxID=1529 RepID=A0A1I2K680_9CLOT|nr:hypothetical protein [Clostridium cadaveris]MDU4950906.1 hypothetical protein [Clostridium sp.]MDM8310853.1 hypothetical protein [Clostridium cadaveris]NWK11470.1 hypothetical protein [Clostridium cadaveris]UFH65636.1 hypothetical protein KQH81_03615 [Clostridium cadaveris]SFF61670.1 hypothetical protein SAMN04487885_104113 [Clostridium cadaveris]
MSAFLGKIHYWLFNKIQLHEKLIEEIVGLSESIGYNSDVIVNESYSKYGMPVEGKLEDEINHSNIHGWLQEKIKSVESRLAYIITELLKNDILKQEEIEDVFYKNAFNTGKELNISEYSPQNVFNLIFDFMLEGMPCDRVNEIVENSDTMIQWKTTREIHKQYWDVVGGDVNEFYSLRDSWIEGFLKGIGSKFKYIRTESGINTIGQV